MPRALFIINPIAGSQNKSAVRDAISHCTLDWTARETRYAGHARELAAVSDADIVVAVGGDGTVNEVAGGLLGTRKAMGILPCGSGNGLARHLKISMNPREAMETINRCQSMDIDTGIVNGRPFFCTCGVGFDAQVSENFANAGRRGVQTYISEALKTWREYESSTYEISIDGRLISQKALLVTVANANQWGNNGLIAPHANIRDGLLDITIVAPFQSFLIPGLVVSLLSGHIDRAHCVYSYTGRDITIVPSQRGPAHCDGEPMSDIDTIHAAIRPASLKVIC